MTHFSREKSMEIRSGES